MALQLNELEVYKEFYGRSIDQMPLLIKEGRTPLSVSGLMKRRIEVADSSNQKLRDAYWLNYFHTGDALARDHKGNIKIVLDAQHLRDINKDSVLLNGGLLSTTEEYARLDGPEFKVGNLNKYSLDKPLTEAQVNEHPMWQALARDPAVLKEYAARTFAKAKEIYKLDENMGLYLPSVQEKPIMRSWCVGGLDGRSDADGDDLDDASGRLVGVAPEALVAKGLEEKI